MGEEIVFHHISRQKNIKEIRDVRNIREYQQKDIDYILVTTDDKEVSIEIKTDSYDSPNIFFETMSCIETNSIGCMYKTQAKYLYYYFLKTNELYIFDMAKYRDWVTENIGGFKKRIVKNWRRGQGVTYCSEGYLVPKESIHKTFKHYNLVILE